MRRTLSRLALAAGLVALAGCSGDNSAQLVGDMNKSNIQRLANLYAGFQNMVSAAGPKDEAEFKAFVSAYAPDKLEMMGVKPGETESLFTSDRDGAPFKVRYKVAGGRGAVAPVVFETVGKDGTKQVGYTGGKVEDVDNATYQRLLTKGGNVEPPGAPPANKTGGRPGSGPPPGAPTGPPG